jgi:hypothetical protein
MRALVVYESMFGNTREVAEAIAEGIGEEALIAEVGRRPSVDPDIDLVVVGGPTHALGLTRDSTRASARGQAEGGRVVSEGIGVREWLDGLPRPTAPVDAAAFDTRVAPVRVPGSAARGIARRLRRKGLHPVADPQTFWVTGTPGPLAKGERERARAWGGDLARTRRSASR